VKAYAANELNQYTAIANPDAVGLRGDATNTATITWNGENRLVCAEEQVCPTNRTLRKVDYAYDHQGRMVWKKISHEDTNTRSWEGKNWGLSPKKSLRWEILVW
jgi:hypothetical protein